MVQTMQIGIDQWCHEIVNGLFLGSIHATDDASEMERKGINHILSLGVEKRQHPRNLVNSLFIDIEDHDFADISPHLPTAIAFIG